MVRVFNHNRTYRLETQDAGRTEYFMLRPLSFADVPEKFTGDITFRLAVKAGEIEVFETTKQGEAIEAKAEAKPEPVEEVKEAETPVKKTRAKKAVEK